MWMYMYYSTSCLLMNQLTKYTQQSFFVRQRDTVFGEIFEQVLFSYNSNNHQSNKNKTYSKISLVIERIDQVTSLSWHVNSSQTEASHTDWYTW